MGGATVKDRERRERVTRAYTEQAGAEQRYTLHEIVIDQAPEEGVNVTARLS